MALYVLLLFALQTKGRQFLFNPRHCVETRGLLQRPRGHPRCYVFVWFLARNGETSGLLVLALVLGLPALTPSHLHTDRSTPSPKNSFPCFAAEAMAEIRLVREIAAQATAALAGSGEGEGDGPNPNQEENASSEVGGGQRARASFLFSFSWVPQRNE